MRAGDARRGVTKPSARTGRTPARDADQQRFHLHRGNVLNVYRTWPTPVTIISDGAYGIRGFHGDTTGPEGLAEW
jgi:hypothetical protein